MTPEVWKITVRRLRGSRRRERGPLAHGVHGEQAHVVRSCRVHQPDLPEQEPGPGNAPMIYAPVVTTTSTDSTTIIMSSMA